MDEVTQAMKQSLESTSGDGGSMDKATKLKLEEGVRAIQYIKQLRSMHMIPTMAAMEEMESTQETSGDMLSSFMNRATSQATGLLAKASAKMGTMLGKDAQASSHSSGGESM